MSFYKKLSTTLIVIIMLSLPLLAACDDDETEEPTAPVTEPVVEDVKVTIGNLTDTTGPASFSLTVVNDALADIVRYSNENNLIPGVELDVRDYDTAYNPANDVPGYEFLKERGADLMLAPLLNTPVSLQSRVNDDQVVLLAMGVEEAAVTPPAYSFCLNSATANKAKTQLQWIAENDWDYEANGPAKIGIVAWATSAFTELGNGAEEYVDAHPEQFEWGGSYYTEIVFDFMSEVNATKDFDYLLVPGAPLGPFVKQYREAGGTAKFLMQDLHTGLGKISDAGLWDMIDGSYFLLPFRWWSEDAKVTNLAKQLVTEYRGEKQLETYIRDGGSYVGSFHQLYFIIPIIKATVENVGVENFSTQALYDTLQNFSYDAGDAYKPVSFTETDRFIYDYEAIYIADSATKDLVRVSEEWLPVLE